MNRRRGISSIRLPVNRRVERGSPGAERCPHTGVAKIDTSFSFSLRIVFFLTRS